MKSRIIEKTCTSLPEFKLFIHELRKNGEFIWRGHASAEWRLSSSLFRYFESQAIHARLRNELEEKAINSFASHFANQLNDSIKDTKIDLMVAMQHYGCPTRLLDWTKSPYIATYFCLSEMAEVAAIYGINLTKYQHMISKDLPLDDYDRGLLTGLPDRYYRIILSQENLVLPIPILPEPFTERHFHQQSVFLLDLRLDTDMENTLSTFAEDLVWKIKLPRMLRLEIYSDLQQMNVDGYHLFKGIEGVALESKTFLFGTSTFGNSIQTDEIDY